VSSDGEFIIRNEGRRPLYLDGKALVSGKSTKLQHNQVLEVMGSAAKPSPLLSASRLEWTIGIFLLPPPPLTSPQVASMSFLVLLNTKLAASVSGAS